MVSEEEKNLLGMLRGGVMTIGDLSKEGFLRFLVGKLLRSGYVLLIDPVQEISQDRYSPEREYGDESKVALSEKGKAFLEVLSPTEKPKRSQQRGPKGQDDQYKLFGQESQSA